MSCLQCSLCSRAFPRQELRCNPVGSGVARNPTNEYLCQQCWQVLCSQPWPAEPDASSSPPQGRGQPLLDVRQQQQQQQLARAMSLSGVGSQTAADAAAALGTSTPGMQGWRNVSLAELHAQHAAAAARAAAAAAAQQQHHHPGGINISGARAQAWHPSSMPEQPLMLGSADDPRWGALAHADAPAVRPGLGPGGASAPVRASLLGGVPSFSPYEMRNLLDEQSLELFESQSHLLDPESRVAVAKQRQFLDWQQSSLEEPGLMQARAPAGGGGARAPAAAPRLRRSANFELFRPPPPQAELERQDSAGSGNEPAETSSIKRQLRAVAGERDRQAQRSNELCQQLQEKKRQLFTAIQARGGRGGLGAGGPASEREQLKEQVRSLEARLKDYHDVTHCRLCQQRPRNCVVLPCLHFLYCDNCFKAHCSASPACPACHAAVSGYQTLIVLK
eukprot:scaffold6.g2589.t1